MSNRAACRAAERQARKAQPKTAAVPSLTFFTPSPTAELHQLSPTFHQDEPESNTVIVALAGHTHATEA